MKGSDNATGNQTRSRRAWYMYDFGNSAYAAVVLLAVYATYFKETVVGGSRGSALWGLSVGIAMLVVALISPILGAIADVSGMKKRFLLLFTGMSCLFTASLFFVTENAVVLGMALLILAEIGYRSAQVFYNALLPEIATQDEIGRISGNGWAIGSAGGVVCLLLVLVPNMLIGGSLVVRASMPFTAVYFAVFAIPVFLYLREKTARQPLPKGKDLVLLPFRRLAESIRAARQHKEFGKFILAFLVYNDGILMTLSFGAILGQVLFGFKTQELIIFMIIVQLASIPGAFLLGRVTDRMGARSALLLSLGVLLSVIVWMYFNTSLFAFYLIGAAAGFALTGVQSVSRTMVGMLAPEGRSAEFYGFFAVAGRTSSFIGPTIFGLVAHRATVALQNSGRAAEIAEQMGHRFALWSIAAFLILGAALLLLVNEKAGRQAAAMQKKRV